MHYLTSLTNFCEAFFSFTQVVVPSCYDLQACRTSRYENAELNEKGME